MNRFPLTFATNSVQGVFHIVQAEGVRAHFVQRIAARSDDLHRHFDGLVTVSAHALEREVFSKQQVAVEFWNRPAFSSAQQDPATFARQLDR